MALNENALRREARTVERTERSMEAVTPAVIGFASVHSTAPSVNAPAPRV